MTFTIDGEELTVDCLMCAVCNGRTYGGGFYAAPEAQPDDGWLDVFIIRRVSRLTIARLLGMYKTDAALSWRPPTASALPATPSPRSSSRWPGASCCPNRPMSGSWPSVPTCKMKV